ncbi:MAG: VOC family protein [Thermoproteota archaeon]|jgi:lactoylglutathione lyase|nr:VOC family protein [Thermoproteota archaeon]
MQNCGIMVYASLRFRKVGAVILLVSNMEKSIKFYSDTLELPVKSRSKDWTEFFNNDTVLALHPAPEKKKMLKTGSGTLVGFEVTDLDSTVKKLREKRVKFFKRPKDEPFGKHAIVQDPDGHLISIAELNEKSSEGFDLLGLIGAE